MKKICLFLVFVSSLGYTQILKPVTWDTSVKKINQTEYLIEFTAQIEKDWHLYSMNLADDGPLPTLFTFDKDDDFTLVGKMSEEKGITEFDKTFNMNITYFKNSTTFKQRIKTTQSTLIITGTIDYMCCNDEKCVPLFDEFEIELLP